jgi:DNA-binding NtrC family response regulator
MVLEKAGYHVDIAADAAASRELLGRWRYAAWLLSRRLQNGDDSLALIDEMRARLERTKVMFLVGGHGEQAALPDAGRHGVVAWVAKNDSRSRIVEAVEKWIGRVSPQPGS